MSTLFSKILSISPHLQVEGKQLSYTNSKYFRESLNIATFPLIFVFKIIKRQESILLGGFFLVAIKILSWFVCLNLNHPYIQLLSKLNWFGYLNSFWIITCFQTTAWRIVQVLDLKFTSCYSQVFIYASKQLNSFALF